MLGNPHINCGWLRNPNHQLRNPNHQLVDGQNPIYNPSNIQCFIGITIVSSWCRISQPSTYKLIYDDKWWLVDGCRVAILDCILGILTNDTAVIWVIFHVVVHIRRKTFGWNFWGTGHSQGSQLTHFCWSWLVRPWSTASICHDPLKINDSSVTSTFFTIDVSA